MNYNKVIYILLGAAVLLAFPLIYLLLIRPGQTTLSPSQWLLLGCVALALVLAAFLPTVVRRLRGLPPHQISPSDIRFFIAVTAVLCPLAFFAVWALGPFGSFVIMLVPLAFAFRFPSRGQAVPSDRNA